MCLELHAGLSTRPGGMGWVCVYGCVDCAGGGRCGVGRVTRRMYLSRESGVLNGWVLEMARRL